MLPQLMLAMMGVGHAITVLLTARTGASSLVALSTGTGTTTSGIRFNKDGKLYQIKGESGGALTYTLIASSTEWAVPHTLDAGPKTYHVKCVRRSVVDGGLESGTEDSYLEIDQNRDWYTQRLNIGGNGTTEYNVTFHLSEDAGSTDILTADIDLDAERAV